MRDSAVRLPDMPYSKEELAADHQRRSKWFRRDRWDKVDLLLAALERYGIYYVDAKPGNITFGDEDSLEDDDLDEDD
jgi:hypothetical protein